MIYAPTMPILHIMLRINGVLLGEANCKSFFWWWLEGEENIEVKKD